MKQKQNVYEQIGLRYKRFMKYVAIVFVVSLIVFFLLSAFNQGTPVLNALTMIALTLALASFVEIPTLFILSKYMLRKAKKSK
ncbi:hypothetical protein [Intestinibaculum porci]|uniref:Uncharacterized protein n=1 Tax=Intestinibaculum porci TaxID=2487118 RepID=A0A3G9JAF4_9FIRM|nr:hypothetical protein [Intestinibaculum porci]MDD6349104.1 hypothetical protein [Intestinibaculum porci]BBH28060.1 hypothetical protein SG0102_29940 [Intestinibaculum porci]